MTIMLGKGARTMLAMAAMAACQGAMAQTDTLRVMQYNLTNYGNYTSSCTSTNNSLASKDPNFEKIIAYFQPQVFGVNEINSNAILVQRLKTLVLNQNGRTWYEGTSGSNRANSDITNALFWDTRKVGLARHWGVSVPVRDIDIFKLYYLPVQGTDTVFFHAIIGHLKAGNTATDAQSRANMVSTLRNYISANLPGLTRAFFMGDLNTYNSNEAAYQLFVNPGSGPAFRDPINRPGAWTGNRSFADIHTQSPRSSGNGCLSGGGMDDRFDQILMTDDLLTSQGTGPRVFYAPGSYWALGQDGRHFNQDITSGGNSSVPLAVAQALFASSDHLPITCKLIVAGIASSRSGQWPSSLAARFIQSNVIQVENQNSQDPVNKMEVFSADGRKLETLNLNPVPSQRVQLGISSGSTQLLIVRISTARSTFTKRLLVLRG